MNGWAVLAVLAAALAGAAVARFVRLPLFPLSGGVLGVGALELSGLVDVAVAQGWRTAAQVLIGTAIGSRVGPTLARDLRAVLLPGALAVCVMLACAGGLGALLIASYGLDPVISCFGMVPGGIGEMVAAADLAGRQGAAVAAVHVLRLLVLVPLLPVAVARLAPEAVRRPPE